MSDYDSGLPIRSELSGVDEVVVSRLCDETDKTKQAAVDSDKNLHVEVHGDDPGSNDKVLRLSQLGAITPDGDYHATNNTAPGSVGLIIHDRATTPSDVNQNFRPTGINSSVNVDVWAIDVAMRDESGNPFNAGNPLSVIVQEGGGDEINHYVVSAAVAAGGTADHIYTVPSGNDFLFRRLLSSASGKMKVEVQINTGAGYNTIAVGFSSTAQPNIVGMEFAPVQLAPTNLVKVIRKNLDNQPQDLYSTIIGVILA